MRSLGSNVGIGLDPDGFSSSLDLMKTVGAFCSGEEPSGSPSGDPEEILSSEGSEDAETNRNMSKSMGWTLQSSLLMLWMEKTRVNNRTKIDDDGNLLKTL